MFYLLGVVVVIGVIGLRAEYSAVAHGQFLRTTLKEKKTKKNNQVKSNASDTSLTIVFSFFQKRERRKRNAPSSTEEMTPVCVEPSQRERPVFPRSRLVNAPKRRARTNKRLTKERRARRKGD